MSKHSNDGFKRLIPKNVVGQPSHQSFEKLTPEDGERYWKAKCKKLEEELKYTKELLSISDATIQEMQANIDCLNEYVELLEQDSDSGDSYDSHGVVPYQSESPRHRTEFSRGLGLSVEADGSSDLYRLSDPDGDLIPKRKFEGVDVEVSPGRGFRVGLRFGKKK